MAYLTGLLGGFSARKSEVEAQNLEESRLAQAREARIYETLINSPDKETRDLAIAGLLESAQPRRRKGGLRGWLGEVEQSPYLSQIQALSPDVEAEEPTYGLPSRQTSGYIGTIPAQESSLAQAPTSPTEVGAPPPTPVTPMPSASITRDVAAPITGTRTVSRPRQVFRTPEDQTRLTRRAQAQGDVEGEVAGLIAAGYSDDEARELVRQNYARGVGASPFQSIAGELPDGTPAFGVFDRVTGGYTDPITDQPIPGFRPRTTTGSTSLGADRESLARELFGKRATQLTPTEMATVDQERIRRAEALSFSRGTGTGRAQIQTELGSPIGITAGAAQGLDPTMTLNTLRGITPITPEQRARLDAAQALAPQIATIKSLVEQVFPDQSRLGGVEASVVLGRKRAARDPQFMSLEASINLALGNVARVLAAEAGRLTEQDAQRARTALADLQGYTDTKESALAKLTIVDQVLQRIGQDIRTPAQQIQDRSAAPRTPPQVGAPPPSGPLATTPQVGDERGLPDGRRIRFDGTGWLVLP
jgi:hypothetical protein